MSSVLNLNPGVGDSTNQSICGKCPVLWAHTVHTWYNDTRWQARNKQKNNIWKASIWRWWGGKTSRKHLLFGVMPHSAAPPGRSLPDHAQQTQGGGQGCLEGLHWVAQRPEAPQSSRSGTWMPSRGMIDGNESNNKYTVNDQMYSDIDGRTGGCSSVWVPICVGVSGGCLSETGMGGMNPPQRFQVTLPVCLDLIPRKSTDYHQDCDDWGHLGPLLEKKWDSCYFVPEFPTWCHSPSAHLAFFWSIASTPTHFF